MCQNISKFLKDPSGRFKTNLSADYGENLKYYEVIFFYRLSN